MGSGVVVPGLKSTGSVVVAQGLSCSNARGILHDQGLNPCLKSNLLFMDITGNHCRFLSRRGVLFVYFSIEIKEIIPVIGF